MIRVVDHEAKGYTWEGTADVARRARVDFLPKEGAKLTLMEGKGAAAKPVATYVGDRDGAQFIAMAWLNGMKPGSNKIAWSKAHIAGLKKAS